MYVLDVRIEKLQTEIETLERINNNIDEQVRDKIDETIEAMRMVCLLYTSPSPRDRTRSRMPSSA